MSAADIELTAAERRASAAFGRELNERARSLRGVTAGETAALAEPVNRLEAAARRARSYLSAEDVTRLTGFGAETTVSDAELDSEMERLRRQIPAAFEPRAGLGGDLGGGAAARHRAREEMLARALGEESNSVDEMIRRAAGR